MKIKVLSLMAVLTVAVACKSTPKTEDTTASKPAPAMGTLSAWGSSDMKKKVGKSSNKSESTTDLSLVKCATKSDERILEIKDKNGGCELIYTKQGTPTSIASGARSHDHCSEVMERIEKKLQGAGYSCQ